MRVSFISQFIYLLRTTIALIQLFTLISIFVDISSNTDASGTGTFAGSNVGTCVKLSGTSSVLLAALLPGVISGCLFRIWTRNESALANNCKQWMHWNSLMPVCTCICWNQNKSIRWWITNINYQWKTHLFQYQPRSETFRTHCTLKGSNIEMNFLMRFQIVWTIERFPTQIAQWLLLFLVMCFHVGK